MAVSTLTWATAPAHATLGPRDGLAMAAYQGTVLAFGGVRRHGDGATELNDLHRFDPGAL